MSETYRTAPSTLRDAWTRFSDLHGSDAPIRTIDDLRDWITKEGLVYGQDAEPWNAAFDKMFDSGWAWAN